jgi:DNA replication and repair protein RecF
MHIKRVEISQFRNLHSTSFTPSPSLSIITGSNGSGKSSILEALHYLATGSSFRTNRLTNVIQQQSNCFTLFAELGNALTHRIGLKRCRDFNHQTRLDGNELSRRSELVQLLPLQVISPESISLLLEGSEGRRNFIDWALFHVEHSFHHHLTSYMRALKQRNALLKSGLTKQILLWDRQLTEHGAVISLMREEYLQRLTPVFNGFIELLLPNMQLDITYRYGWPVEATLMEALSVSIESDLRVKHTTVGPHRGDMSVKCEGVKASERLSRGQLKLAVIALKLAQISLLRSSTQKSPVILIDDLAAELDIEHRALLLSTVKQFSVQVFLTTPDLSLIDYSGWSDRKVFHVEHGQIKEVV